MNVLGSPHPPGRTCYRSLQMKIFNLFEHFHDTCLPYYASSKMILRWLFSSENCSDDLLHPSFHSFPMIGGRIQYSSASSLPDLDLVPAEQALHLLLPEALVILSADEKNYMLCFFLLFYTDHIYSLNVPPQSPDSLLLHLIWLQILFSFFWTCSYIQKRTTKNNSLLAVVYDKSNKLLMITSITCDFLSSDAMCNRTW